MLHKWISPKLYESSNRIWWRIYTDVFEKDPNAIAELWAIRFSIAHINLVNLLKRFDIKTIDFPDALLTPTRLNYNGENYNINPWDSLPKDIQNIRSKIMYIMQPLIQSINEDINNLDYIIKEHKNNSLGSVLSKNWRIDEEILLLWWVWLWGWWLDSFLDNSFVEVLKMFNFSLDNRRLVVWWMSKIINSLWHEKIWLNKKSLFDIMSKNIWIWAQEIWKDGNKIYIIDSKWDKILYDKVIITLPLPAIKQILIKDNLFTDEQKIAINELPIKKAVKIFFLTKNAFRKGDFSKDVICTTVTDNPLRTLSLFDKTHFWTDTNAWVILASYSFGEASLVFDKLSNDDKVNLVIESIEKIYWKDLINILKDEIIETKIISWNTEPWCNWAYVQSFPWQESIRQSFSKTNDDNLIVIGEAAAPIHLWWLVEWAIYSASKAIEKI